MNTIVIIMFVFVRCISNIIEVKFYGDLLFGTLIDLLKLDYCTYTNFIFLTT